MISQTAFFLPPHIQLLLPYVMKLSTENVCNLMCHQFNIFNLFKRSHIWNFDFLPRFSFVTLGVKHSFYDARAWRKWTQRMSKLHNKIYFYENVYVALRMNFMKKQFLERWKSFQIFSLGFGVLHSQFEWAKVRSNSDAEGRISQSFHWK